MSSLSPKDRVSLCLFTYEDGRRCRTPRISSHPHFCFYHAQKEARSQTTEKLGKDLAYFFSGDYLSACDLSTALARLIPAVVRGDIKPKLARTVAYMFQTLLQSIHISQDEYANAFGTEGWRKAVRKSVNSNYDYRFPPTPKPATPTPRAPATHPPATQPPTPSTPTQPPAQPPANSTSVGAGLAQPDHPTYSTTPASEAPAPPITSTPQPPSAARPAAACHPERSEGPCLPASPTIDVTHLPSTLPTENPPTHTPQPPPVATPPTPADEALSVARSLFRRHKNTTPANSFTANIYAPPRNY